MVSGYETFLALRGELKEVRLVKGFYLPDVIIVLLSRRV